MQVTITVGCTNSGSSACVGHMCVYVRKIEKNEHEGQGELSEVEETTERREGLKMVTVAVKLVLTLHQLREAKATFFWA